MVARRCGVNRGSAQAQPDRHLHGHPGRCPPAGRADRGKSADVERLVAPASRRLSWGRLVPTARVSYAPAARTSALRKRPLRKKRYGAIETGNRTHQLDGNGVDFGPRRTYASGAPSPTPDMGDTTSACARAAP